MARARRNVEELPDHMVKGNLAEQIVATLHEEEGLLVRSNVRLPPRDRTHRIREIDVLVTGHVLGRPMHLAAFECKNYGKPISVGKIGDFRDKLDDIGIPVQHGIYVSTSGFTEDARIRAQDLGMRLYVLEGLTRDRLATEMHEAIQSVVYSLLTVDSVTTTPDDGNADLNDWPYLQDPEYAYQGTDLDFVWAHWQAGNLPMQLGKHAVTVAVPRRLKWVRRAGPMPATTTAAVTITGHIVVVKGIAERFVLRDALTGIPERGRTQSKFDDWPNSLPVVTVNSEDELRAVLEQPAISRVTIGRFPLPRIRCSFYWPPSDRMLLYLRHRNVEQLLSRRPPIFADEIPFAELESTDISTLWEPISSAHPAAHDPNWPWSLPRRRPTAPRGRIKRHP